MNFQNIIKILSGLLGVLGVVFLFRIMGLGDDQIKMDASMGDFSSVTPLISLALIILSIAIVVTLIFSIRNLASDSNKLKKAMIASGLFLLIIAIGYGLSEGIEPAFTTGTDLFAIIIYFLIIFLILENIIDPKAIKVSM